jgi:hypothetical protein
MLSRGDVVRLGPRTGRYRLDFAILKSAGFLLADVDVRREAQPIMRELAERVWWTPAESNPLTSSMPKKRRSQATSGSLST